ncbi:MAG: chemotaxis protein CheX [Candidatus Sericytochromatia bacterium]
MKSNFNSCFSNAVKEVISNLCQCEDITNTEFEMKEFSFFSADISIFLNISGKLRGSIFYSMSKDFALELSSIMIGFPISEIDELSKSSLLELANMISGKAMTKLSDLGHYCETSIPVFMNKGDEIPFKNTLGVHFETETPIGVLYTGISLRES